MTIEIDIKKLSHLAGSSDKQQVFLIELNQFFSRLGSQRNPHVSPCLLNILEILVLKQWWEAANRLYAYNLKIDQSFLSRLPTASLENRLMQACRYNILPLIETLAQESDLLRLNSEGLNALMQVQSVEAAEILCKAAVKKGCFKALLFYPNLSLHTAYDYLVKTKYLPKKAFFEDFDFEPIDTDDPDFFSPVKGSLLCWAVWKKDLELVTFLIEKLKLDLEKTMDYSATYYNGQTPLAVACYLRNVAMVKLLLDYHPNLLCKTKDGYTLFHLADLSTMMLISEKATPEQIKILLSSKAEDNRHSIPLFYHYEFGQLQIVNYLMELMDVRAYMTHSQVASLLHLARVSCWNVPEDKKPFEIMCERIRCFAVTPLTEYSLEKRTPIHVLFEEEKDESWMLQFQTAKEHMLKKVVSDIYALFYNPVACFELLGMLNEELIAYLNGVIPLFSKEYSFCQIGDLLYPFPHKSFEGIKMHGALNALLLLIFKKYQLGGEVRKWIGYIPNDKADDFLRKGGFAIESGIGPGLFHGKIIHMLQMVLIIYFFEANRSDYSFVFNNAVYAITIPEILDSYFSLKTKTGVSLWTPTHDRRFISAYAYFFDPYAFNSFLMYKGPEYGLSLLADYLINSFCKGLLKYYNAYTLILYPNITFEEFIRHMQEVKQHIFSALPNPILKKSILDAQYKSNFIGDFGKSHAMSPKLINCNSRFFPRDFVPHTSSCEEDRSSAQTFTEGGLRM